MTIELKDVRFAYPKAPKEMVLSIDHWKVSAKEHVFVHGPSGSGKSTLLNLLSGMLKATAGQVSILNQRLDTISNRQRDQFRANHIGYVFQQFNLIPYLDAIDNILLAAHFAQHSNARALRADIESLLSSLNIAAGDWQKPAAYLSIGQQQRVAIARALINNPELLIADEPTSSLDQKNRDAFMALLMSIAVERDTTVLFVSHDLTLSQHFNRVDALAEINHPRKARSCS